MILKIIFAFIMTLGTSGQYTPSTDTFLFGLTGRFPLFSPFNLYDGPSSISNARTTPTMSIKPTLEQMMYYNYYSAAMYCPYELNTLSCVHCQNFKNDVSEHLVMTNDVADTVAIVAVSQSRQEIVVAYRGSMNIANYILDVILYNAPTPNGLPSSIKIHRGFYIATMSLYEDVVKAVEYQRILHPDYKIVFTGHSLGAAMARIMQFLLLSVNQFPGATYEVYTYGEPRVGNKYFADFINAQNITTARIVARADSIPHFPPTSILGTKLLGDYYVQVQTEFWINGKDGQRFCNQRVYEDPTCSNSLGPHYSPILGDHIGYYFDVNYAICFVNQPLPLFTFPVIFQPVGLVPPLPKRLSKFLEDGANFVVDTIAPIVGR